MGNLNFVAIDLETATQRRNSICEIGITIVKDATIVESKSWLVEPPDNFFQPFNIAIHHITPELTENAPTFPQVWQEVSEYLNGQVVVAHNASFDMYVLKDTFDTFEIPYPQFDYYCSYRLAQKVIKGLSSYSLPLLCNSLDIKFGTHHRAENDSVGCAEIFIKCVSRAGVRSLQELQSKFNFRCGRFDAGYFRPQRSYSQGNTKDSTSEKLAEAKFANMLSFY